MGNMLFTEKQTVYMNRSLNKCYESLELAKQAVIDHAKEKGYTVKFEKGNIFIHCMYFDNDGNDTFGNDTDYGCLIEPIEYIKILKLIGG